MSKIATDISGIVKGEVFNGTSSRWRGNNWVICIDGLPHISINKNWFVSLESFKCEKSDRYCINIYLYSGQVISRSYHDHILWESILRHFDQSMLS